MSNPNPEGLPSLPNGWKFNPAQDGWAASIYMPDGRHVDCVIGTSKATLNDFRREFPTAMNTHTDALGAALAESVAGYFDETPETLQKHSVNTLLDFAKRHHFTDRLAELACRAALEAWGKGR